jgi:hypothetical protein
MKACFPVIITDNKPCATLAGHDLRGDPSSVPPSAALPRTRDGGPSGGDRCRCCGGVGGEAELGEGVAQDARDLHLADADDLADLGLGQVLFEAQADDLALAGCQGSRERGDGRALFGDRSPIGSDTAGEAPFERSTRARARAWMGIALGVGLALVVDEAPLSVELRDVYWTGSAQSASVLP